jgi:hypothetical protein
MLVGVSDRDNPGKTKALAAEPRIDLTNEQGANAPPLDSASPRQNDRMRVLMLGSDG